MNLVAVVLVLGARSVMATDRCPALFSFQPNTNPPTNSNNLFTMKSGTHTCDSTDLGCTTTSCPCLSACCQAKPNTCHSFNVPICESYYFYDPNKGAMDANN